MRNLVVIAVMLTAVSSLTFAQKNRATVSSGAGKFSTVGQVVVGYSSYRIDADYKLWQGFWIPSKTRTSILDDTWGITKNNVNLYPSITSTAIQVVSNKNIDRIEIYSNLGALVYSGKNVYIDVSVFPVGNYIVKSYLEDNTLETDKFLIVR